MREINARVAVIQDLIIIIVIVLFHVESEGVLSHEAFLAVFALERL